MIQNHSCPQTSGLWDVPHQTDEDIENPSGISVFDSSSEAGTGEQHIPSSSIPGLSATLSACEVPAGLELKESLFLI